MTTNLARLLQACVDAKRHGMWRGREGIAAYRKMCSALNRFNLKVHSVEEQVDPDAGERLEPVAPHCVCPSWPCPRHYDSASPADTEAP